MERLVENNYKKNRERVAEIYGLDPKECSFHHICPKAEVKEGHFEGLIDETTLHEKANLYPFECDGENFHSSEHCRLHALITRHEATLKPVKRHNRQVLYQSKK